MADLAYDASGPASSEPTGIALQQANRPFSSDNRGKLRVFISYSREDLNFADQLDAALSTYGFECLVDRHGISGGEDWKQRLADKNIAKAVAILREKFADVRAFGPQQVVEFLNSNSDEERAMQARRAFELVQALLRTLD